MQRSPSHRRRQARRLTGMATAAIVTAGLMSVAPTAQGQDQPVPADRQDATVHGNGKALGKAGATPADTVKNYFQAHGHNAETAASLKVDGPAWSERGVSHLRLDQHVAGLRVYDTYAKAAFNSSGKLVHLVENVADVSGAPAAASVDSAAALRAAVKSLYPNRAVDTTATGTAGNTTSFAKNGFYAEPTVEKVAVPTVDGGLAEGYVVQTWTLKDNQLYETLVGGDGTVVDNVLRTASDQYNIFPENPDESRQTVVRNPAGPESPAGWLFAGTQLSKNISGNNAHAYLDTNNDNAPDAGGTAINNGRFLAKFDPNTQPSTSTNRDVAIQNLFYLNNLIHDTLYRAGFDEAAGNFQEKNFTGAGRDSDPVAAEGQDGGGIDNANFATPVDGQDPRMQMYLWSVPGMFEVNVPAGPAAGRYLATGATWGAQITEAGVTGQLAVANDGVGTTSDACEALPAGSMAGKVAIADRGLCDFVVKAHNVQDAGAVGIVVANNVAGSPITMGGADRKVVIPGLMVSQADGATLKTGAGTDATLRLNPNAILKDGDLDSDIVWHEYGHGLTWRMIGRMDGPMAGAIGEGMSDVLSIIANEDDRIGEYSASDPLGIRTEPYATYSRTYGDIQGQEVHLDGEVYGAIGWALLQNYNGAKVNKSVLLADLVDGMNFTPAQPTMEQMRDGILAGLNASGNSSRACLVWNAFAKFGVGVGAQATVTGNSVSVTESFAKPAECGA